MKFFNQENNDDKQTIHPGTNRPQDYEHENQNNGLPGAAWR